jgi:hypothetical protein
MESISSDQPWVNNALSLAKECEAIGKSVDGEIVVRLPNGMTDETLEEVRAIARRQLPAGIRFVVEEDNG